MMDNMSENDYMHIYTEKVMGEGYSKMLTIRGKELRKYRSSGTVLLTFL